MKLEEVNKFLDGKLNLLKFEDWVYKTSELENLIGQEGYDFLIGFNYTQEDAHYELKKYLLSNVTNEIEFADWKVSELLTEIDVNKSNEDLFSYFLENPTILEGKKTEFTQLWTSNEISINWTNEVKQFVRHTSEYKKEPDYLDLGEFNNGYIYLILNRKNEVWVAYDIIDKQEYFAKSLAKAITRLILEKN
jgi:hypothetical protein